MAIAILRQRDIPRDDLVVIPRKEYEDLKDRVDALPVFPIVRLRGNAARKLDRRVSAALREYHAGKLKPVRTLRELL
jgi:hypothetical protein